MSEVWSFDTYFASLSSFSESGVCSRFWRCLLYSGHAASTLTTLAKLTHDMETGAESWSFSQSESESELTSTSLVVRSATWPLAGLDICFNKTDACKHLIETFFFITTLKTWFSICYLFQWVKMGLEICFSKTIACKLLIETFQF